ncbi:unnamed protein product, partial [Chrysoparadoxa australica]
AAALKLSILFERLLLDWLADPAAPSLERLDDKLCSSCRSDEEDESAAAMAVCDRCESRHHLPCVGLKRVPARDWFCVKCIAARSLGHVDLLVGRRVERGLGWSSRRQKGEVVDVRYCRGKRMYTVKWQASGEVQGGVEQVAAAALAELYGVRSQEQSAAALLNVEVPGYGGWGLTCPRADRCKPFPLPLCMDPAVSATSAELIETNPEFHTLADAIFALDMGCRSSTDWVTVLSAMVSLTCVLGDEVHQHLVKGELKASELVKEIMQREPRIKASTLTLPRELQPVVVPAEEAGLAHSDVDSDGFESEGDAEAAEEVLPMAVDEAETEGEAPEHAKQEQQQAERNGGNGKLCDEGEPSDKMDAVTNKMDVVTDLTEAPPVAGVRERAAGPTMSEEEGLWRRGKLSRAKRREEQLLLTALLEEMSASNGEKAALEMAGLVSSPELLREAQTRMQDRQREKEAGVKQEAPVCDCCHATEIALCSAFVEGQSWEEASRLLLALRASSGKETGAIAAAAAGEADDDDDARDVTAIHQRLAEAGLYEEEHNGHQPKKPRVDLGMCLWIPVNEAEKEAELQHSCLPKAKTAAAADPSVSSGAAAGQGEQLSDAAVSLLGLSSSPSKPEAAAAAPVQVKRAAPLVMRGSLSVHECCAESMLSLLELAPRRLEARMCREMLEAAALRVTGGRTLPLGRDMHGRLFWQFAANPRLLLVEPARGEGQLWLCYSELTDVASAVLQLNPKAKCEEALQRSLLRQYPHVCTALRDKTFVKELLLAKNMPECNGGSVEPAAALDAMPGGRPKTSAKAQFKTGDEVIMRCLKPGAKASNGSVSWLHYKGKVQCVVEGTNQYRVQLAGWGSRFTALADEGELLRALPEEIARLEQLELEWQDGAARETSLPMYLQGFAASVYMEYPGRARGARSPPVFSREEIMADGMLRAKAALLTIEAALPQGARMYSSGQWDDKHTPMWIAHVTEAENATELMEACLLLEN